jgi:hypothetical protein
LLQRPVDLEDIDLAVVICPAALALVTYTKSVVAVPQAVIRTAASRLVAVTSRSWLDLLNFMRIFRQRAKGSGP